MKKIVVIGGGYGGVSFVKQFSKFDIDAEVYLIDQNPYQYLQPEVYSFIANESIISDIIIDLSTLCEGLGKNIHFFKEKVNYIDPDRNEIYGNRFKLKYDYLIIAAGSKTFFPPIEGLREHAAGVKTLDRSLQFKQKFEKKILQKIQEEEKCYIVKENQFSIVVGGAGLAGVEIAAEMAYYAKEFFKRIGFLCEGLNITLIEAADRILPGMDEFVYQTAYSRLKSLGVNILTGKKIIKVDKENVYFEDEDFIKQDFFIWTGGIVASTLIEKMRIKTNKRKQAIVNEYFRPEGIDNIFIIGDCAQITNYETGEILPPMAQIAIQTGEITARYLRDTLKGKKPKVESPVFKGMVSALGGKYGVGMIKNGIKFKGFPAYLFKELVFLHYKLPLRHISKKGYRRLLEQ